MTNERLRGAITGAGMNFQQFGEKVGVDPKTVERWVSKDRLPHRTHRLNAAAILGKSDLFLWPQTETDPRSLSASQAELVSLYPNRGAIPLSIWMSLIDDASECIDLLALAGSFLHDAIPEFGERLTSRAEAGVRVRLLFGEPAGQSVTIRGVEEGIDALMSARVELTWKYLRPLLSVPGIEARRHDTTLYASIFRFDDTLLANVHSYGMPASHSPVLHLNRIPGGRLFDHYLNSFDRVWASAGAAN